MSSGEKSTAKAAPREARAKHSTQSFKLSPQL